MALDLFKTPSLSEGWKGVAWVAVYRPSRADELTMSPLYRRIDGLMLYGDPDFINDLLGRVGRANPMRMRMRPRAAVV
jgi:hypothetical protein